MGCFGSWCCCAYHFWMLRWRAEPGFGGGGAPCFARVLVCLGGSLMVCFETGSERWR